MYALPGGEHLKYQQILQYDFLIQNPIVCRQRTFAVPLSFTEFKNGLIHTE